MDFLIAQTLKTENDASQNVCLAFYSDILRAETALANQEITVRDDS